MPPVNLRTSSESPVVIDRAAAIRGISGTEFVLWPSEPVAVETPRRHAVLLGRSDTGFLVSGHGAAASVGRVQGHAPLGPMTSWHCDRHQSVLMSGLGGSSKRAPVSLISNVDTSVRI